MTAFPQLIKGWFRRQPRSSTGQDLAFLGVTLGGRKVMFHHQPDHVSPLKLHIPMFPLAVWFDGVV